MINRRFRISPMLQLDGRSSAAKRGILRLAFVDHLPPTGTIHGSRLQSQPMATRCATISWLRHPKGSLSRRRRTGAKRLHISAFKETIDKGL